MRYLMLFCAGLLAMTACGSPESAPIAAVDSTQPAQSTTTASTVPSTTTTEPAMTTTVPPAPTTSALPADLPAAGYFSLTGDRPQAFPDHWGVGFIELGETSIADIEEVLGPVESAGSVGYGYQYSWNLAGSSLSVSTHSDSYDVEDTAGGLDVSTPPGSSARLGLAGGVVLGTDSLDDLRATWGEPVLCSAIGKADCDVLYERCVGSGNGAGPLMVLAAGDSTADGTGELTWSDRIRGYSVGFDQFPESWDRCRAVSLTSTGLGIVSFGEPEESVMAELTQVLGPTVFDRVESGSTPMGMQDGYPANLRFRAVQWPDLGLVAVFSDGVEWPDGRSESVFIGWSLWAASDAPFELATTEGLTVGSPAADVTATYGDALSDGEIEVYPGWYGMLPPAFPDARPIVGGLFFVFDLPPTDPASTVVAIHAGAAQAP